MKTLTIFALGMGIGAVIRAMAYGDALDCALIGGICAGIGAIIQEVTA